MRKFVAAVVAALVLVAVAPAAGAEKRLVADADSGSDAPAAEPRIVDGSPAPAGRYPWMAAFLFNGGQGCGGSVIAPNWVLTAAHCVTDERGQPSVGPSDVSFVVNTNDWTQGGQVLNAAQIVVHPAYDPLLTNNDVALVRTTESTAVTPVQLAGPADAAVAAAGATARVIGYGTIRTGGPASQQLLEVDVTVVSDAACQSQGYGNAIIASNMVCAGDPTPDSADPGPDSCQGDSGGPLFGPAEGTGAGTDIQFGIVSFGGECGVDRPGVYAEVATYKDWIDGILDGSIQPEDPDPGQEGNPDGGAVAPIRITGANPNDPVDTAIAVSNLVFQQGAEFGVLASSSKFPDALGGSALASYYGPLLFVNADGSLAPRTLAEFQRVLSPGSFIYVLGGTAAVPQAAADQLNAAGFVVERLGGANRQDTALLVARKVNEVVNFDTPPQGDSFPPFDAVIVAQAGNWPDAVTVSQISAWFGIPVILTPTASLGEPAAEYLRTWQPTSVIVLGGDAAIAPQVEQQIHDTVVAASGGQFVPEIERIAGPTRIQTAAATTLLNRYVLFPFSDQIFQFAGEPITEPQVILAANLRRSDAFAHILAASPIVGIFGGVFAPIMDGSGVDQTVLDSVCAMDVEVFDLGGPDLVPNSVLPTIQQASLGNNCSAG